VDIVPQVKRLRLSLNTLEEVPYALGLIRQPLERQLEGGS
jgi:predicted transport protein